MSYEANSRMKKSSFDEGTTPRSSAFGEGDAPRVSKLRSIEGARSIEQYHWRNLVRYLFPTRDTRTSIGICSLTQEGSIAGFVSRLCIHATLHLSAPVLLIEAHASRPSLAEQHGVLPSPGLANLLTSSPEPLYRCIRRTDYARLWMIPCGGSLPTYDEKAMEISYRNIFATMPRALRNVVVALPPVRANRDVSFLCSVSDRIVFVVRPRSVTGRDIRAAVDRVSKTSAKVAGVIWADNRSLDAPAMV